MLSQIVMIGTDNVLEKSFENTFSEHSETLSNRVTDTVSDRRDPRPDVTREATVKRLIRAAIKVRGGCFRVNVRCRRNVKNAGSET